MLTSNCSNKDCLTFFSNLKKLIEGLKMTIQENVNKFIGCCQSHYHNYFEQPVTFIGNQLYQYYLPGQQRSDETKASFYLRETIVALAKTLLLVSVGSILISNIKSGALDACVILFSCAVIAKETNIFSRAVAN